MNGGLELKFENKKAKFVLNYLLIQKSSNILKCVLNNFGLNMVHNINTFAF